MEQAVFEPLVEGLAKEGYAIFDHFLSGAEVDTLLATFRSLRTDGEFKTAGIGRASDFQHNRTIRGDMIRWVDRESLDTECHFFFDRLDGLIQYINRSCFLGIKSSELHFAVFPAGSFYKRHLDVFRQSQGRVLSVVCYLNPGWVPENGGQLRIYLPGDQSFDILPEAGRLVCFRSDVFEHEVLPSRIDRRSITGWLRNIEPLI